MKKNKVNFLQFSDSLLWLVMELTLEVCEFLIVEEPLQTLTPKEEPGTIWVNSKSLLSTEMQNPFSSLDFLSLFLSVLLLPHKVYIM